MMIMNKQTTSTTTFSTCSYSFFLLLCLLFVSALVFFTLFVAFCSLWKMFNRKSTAAIPIIITLFSLKKNMHSVSQTLRRAFAISLLNFSFLTELSHSLSLSASLKLILIRDEAANCIRFIYIKNFTNIFHQLQKKYAVRQMKAGKAA